VVRGGWEERGGELAGCIRTGMGGSFFEGICLIQSSQRARREGEAEGGREGD